MTFDVTGDTGTVGFGNVTIPKSAVAPDSTPVLYIDGAVALDQGYTEDANNFYVWYTVHFSSHEVSIVFTVTPQTRNDLPQGVLIAIVAVIVVVVDATVILIWRARRKAKV